MLKLQIGCFSIKFSDDLMVECHSMNGMFKNLWKRSIKSQFKKYYLLSSLLPRHKFYVKYTSCCSKYLHNGTVVFSQSNDPSSLHQKLELLRNESSFRSSCNTSAYSPTLTGEDSSGPRREWGRRHDHFEWPQRGLNPLEPQDQIRQSKHLQLHR